jgi:hypothetical protein
VAEVEAARMALCWLAAQGHVVADGPLARGLPLPPVVTSPASPSACAPQPSPSAVRSGQAVPPGSPRQPELVPPPHTVRQQGGDVQQQQQRELEGLVGTANVDWKSVLQTLVARAASAVGAQCPTPQYTVPSFAVRSSSLATVSGCYAPFCDCCPFVLGRCVMGLQAFFVVRASPGTAATVMSCR